MPGLFWLMSLSVLAITPREISTQLCPDANSARKLRHFIPLFGTKSNLYHYEKIFFSILAIAALITFNSCNDDETPFDADADVLVL